MSAFEIPRGGFPAVSLKQAIRRMPPHRNLCSSEERCRALVGITGRHARLRHPRSCKKRGVLFAPDGTRYCRSHYERETGLGLDTAAVAS